MGIIQHVEDIGNSSVTPLRVMTFNVRVASWLDFFTQWHRPRGALEGFVRGLSSDVIGFQEMLRPQVDSMATALERHEWFGVGRDDGRDKGEFNPIFYRRDRFERLDGRTFWLSETPERPGSRGWREFYRRIVTWVRLRDRNTAREFYVFNTHFTVANRPARRHSAVLLLSRIAEIAGDSPVVVTGDFNFRPNSRGYRILTTGRDMWIDAELPAMQDAMLESQGGHFGPVGTFRGFGRMKKAHPRIDYIFTSPKVRVLRHETPAPEKGTFPSDHLPVMADVVLE